LDLFSNKNMKARYRNMKRYIINEPVSQPNDSGGKIFTPETFIEVIINNPPSCETVPSAVREDGHGILKFEEIDRDVWRILIRKIRG